MTVYAMQIVRFSKSDCVTGVVDIGKPMKVVADCLEAAKRGAACKALPKHHQGYPIYDWLTMQTRGQSSKILPFHWEWSTVNITN